MRSSASALLTRTLPRALVAAGLLLGLNACGSSVESEVTPLVCDGSGVGPLEASSPQASADFDSQAEALLTSNRLAANRLAANRIALNRISLNRISLNRLAANKLAANRLAANRLAANRLAANKLAANRLAANRLAANKLAANRLAANRLAANKLATNRLAANKLATNKLAINKLATNRIATNRLAANKLATNRIALNQLDVEALGLADIMRSAEDRDFLKYLFECALPADTVLEMPLPVDSTEADAAAETVDFAGSIGLAADWLEAPLSLTQRRWVSACLLSRVNAFGVSVEISMRGPNAALDADAAESAEWSLQEGAFFGDLFTDPDSPVLGYACRAPRAAGIESESLQQRVCTEPDPENLGFTRCGLVYVGECAGASAVPTGVPTAGPMAVCKARTSTGAFTGCLPPDAEDLTPVSCPLPGESAYPEVITTYLKR